MQKEKIEEWEARKDRFEKKLAEVKTNTDGLEAYLQEAPKEKHEAEQKLVLLKSKEVSEEQKEQHEIEVARAEVEVGAVEQNIEIAKRLVHEYKNRIAFLEKSIESAKAKIDELKKAQEVEQSVTPKPVDANATSKCPKKCTIDSVKLSWPEPIKNIRDPDKDSARSVDIQVVTGEVPRYEVIGSGKENDKKLNVMRLDVSGSCDHGRSQNAGDSKEWKEKKRHEGQADYCPKAHIHSSDGKTDIIRPGSVLFNAATEHSKTSEDPVAYLFKKLVFGKDFDVREYEVDIYTCKGETPQKAIVAAHPYKSWSFELEIGYSSATKLLKKREKKPGNEEEYETFDHLEAEGKWGAKIDLAYTYEDNTANNSYELSFDDAVRHLSSQWPFIKTIKDFMSPALGFFERSEATDPNVGKDLQGSSAKKNEKAGQDKGNEVAKIGVTWPTIKITGEYENKEFSDYKVGGEGSISIAFDPLFGINSEVDIIQFALASLGGPVGNFLRYISNLSLGKKDASGEIDKSGSYIETNLSLKIGAKATVKGSMTWLVNDAKGWHHDKGAKVGGKVELILKGEVSAKGKLGKVWYVYFGVGAEIEARNAAGDGKPGYAVDCAAAWVNGKFSPEVEIVFNGFSIIHSVYKNGGINGAGKSKRSGDSDSGSFLGGALEKAQVEDKHSTVAPWVLLPKRVMWANS